MSALLPILMLGVAGLFMGGAISMYRQKASTVTVVVLGLLGVLAAAAGILWLGD
jgi:hypothetical protein